MTALRKLFAFLLALGLFAGAPASALADAAPGADCSTSAGAAGDNGCCNDGGGAVSGCGIVCAVTPAAAMAEEKKAFTPDPALAPGGAESIHPGLAARAPDTAPPKFLPA